MEFSAMDVKKKRITQKEIATLANVCQGAVSAVLSPNYKGNTKVSPEVRERILKIVEAHHYFPNRQARALRGGGSDLVGVLTNAQISQLFYDLLLPLEAELHQVHKRMLIGQLGNDPQENELVLQSFINYNLDGVIVLHHDIIDGGRLFQRYQDLLPPMVFLDPPPAEVESRWVEIDYACGVQALVEELFRRGRRRIALCMNDVEFRSMRMRLDGYRAGLAAVGLAWEEELVFLREAATESVAQRIARAVDRFDALGVDAVIAGNDEWAVVLLKEFARRGVAVPERIAVAGYGDTLNICRSATPELTSVQHGNAEVAQKIVEMLQNPDGQFRQVHTRMVIRESI